MNSKNKTVILTMAMAVAFAVTGCGSKQSADTSPAVSSSSETNETVVASDAADDTVASASRIAADGGAVGKQIYIIKSREGKSLSAFFFRNLNLLPHCILRVKQYNKKQTGGQEEMRMQYYIYSLFCFLLPGTVWLIL